MLKGVRRLIIGAPFGNYFHFPNATSTLGTYTLKRRAGPLGRVWRVLKTVRYHAGVRSWTNRLGLPSPGIRTLTDATDRILSIHGFNKAEWNALYVEAELYHPLAVELNLSCPNVGSVPFSDVEYACERLLQLGVTVIAKLPPVRWMEWGSLLYVVGVRCFHLCNTMPSPAGGVSGKLLMPYSLWAVRDFRQTYGTAVTLIGGGGVTSADDVRAYRKAGADHVAVASMLLNPFRWRTINRLTAAAKECTCDQQGVYLSETR